MIANETTLLNQMLIDQYDTDINRYTLGLFRFIYFFAFVCFRLLFDVNFAKIECIIKVGS